MTKNTTSTLDIEQFTKLFLTFLAKKSKNKKDVYLSNDYKEAIENIMFSENKLALGFRKIIDLGLYYSEQSTWEKEFSMALKTYLDKNNKDIKYDFVSDSIIISFTKEEVDNNLDGLDDNIIKLMRKFTKLFQDFSKMRECNLVKKEIKKIMTNDF